MTASTGAYLTNPNYKAIVGDFSQIRWGVQREVPVELIRFGDPDGLGDLKRKNQIALRLEMQFGFAIMDTERLRHRQERHERVLIVVRLLAPSGSVVNVSDEKAARLGWPRYVPESAPEPSAQEQAEADQARALAEAKAQAKQSAEHSRPMNPPPPPPRGALSTASLPKP